MPALLINHVGDADSRCNLHEVWRDTAVQAHDALCGKDVLEEPHHGDWGRVNHPRSNDCKDTTCGHTYTQNEGGVGQAQIGRQDHPK